MFKTEPDASSRTNFKYSASKIARIFLNMILRNYPQNRNSSVAGNPDLIKTLEQLKSYLNDPRIAELDSCFDLTKRKNAKFRKKNVERKSLYICI